MSRTPLLITASFTALLSACMPVTTAGPPPNVEDAALARPAATVTSAEVMAEPAVIVSDAAPSAGRYTGPVRRGVVTAGDIDDTRNLGPFTRYVQRTVAETGLPRLGLGAPVIAQLIGPDGSPAPGARYTLRRPGAADPFHTGYAGPDGRITDFPQVLGAGNLASVELRVIAGATQETFAQTLQTGTFQTIRLPFAAVWQPEFLDLVLVVDTTGSMGDEIAFLNRELIGITRAAARSAPGLSVRYGLVAYRDQGDEYVVKNYGFTDSSAAMSGWLRTLVAGGGGDYPEAAAAALAAGVALDWRRGQGERLLIHVADAPPHDTDAAAYLRAAKSAASNGVQIFPLGASGVGTEAEYLMRQAAVATQGRYLFLTDDSGVGAAHAEPSIACYRVTQLSGLLTRILATELSGQRQEAGGSDIIRTVGSYQAGVCRE